MFSPLEQFDIIFYNWGGLPFVHIITPFILIIIILKGITFLTFDSFLLIPRPLQRVIEVSIEFISNSLRQQVGKDGYIYFPLLFVLFHFILLANLLSLLPFGIALTSHIVLIFWLTFSVCLSIFFVVYTRIICNS